MDTIKHKGCRVSASEIEALVQEHPAIVSTCVVGIPDEKVGERIKSYVVLKEDIEEKRQRAKRNDYWTLNNRLHYNAYCEILTEKFISILCPNFTGGKMGKRKKPSKIKIPLSKPIRQNPKYPHLRQEVNTIVQLSQHREARLTTLGKLVLFSTKTGDAWVLDADRGLAKCLSRDGEKQAFTINETSPDHAIEWDSEYRIKGSLFTVLEYSGSVCSILGYPIRQIEEAIEQMGVQ